MYPELRGVFTPNVFIEGESTNLHVRVDYTNISLLTLVSTELASKKTGDKPQFHQKLHIPEKSITGHCPE